MRANHAWVFVVLLALAAPDTVWSQAADDAQAQEGDRARPGRIEAITVTARKKEESAQDTPLSLSVLSFDDLEKQSVEDVQDLQYQVPNLNINQSQATASTASLSIRGVGTGGFTGAEDNAVSVYQNGVYISRVVGLLSDVYDMERIEVLRGPQGTLFGRNTTGGALSMWSRRPDGTFNGYVGATYGSRDLFETRGAVGFPILGETLSGRFAWLGRDRGKLKRSRQTDSDYEDNKVYNFRGSLRWMPSDDIDVLFVVDRRKARDGSPAAKLKEVNRQGSLTSPVAPGAPSIADFVKIGNGQPIVPEETWLAGDDYSTDIDGRSLTFQRLSDGELQNDDVWGYALDVTIGFDDLTFHSLTGNRRLDANRSGDQDGIPDDFFWSGDAFGNDSWQQEFQLSGLGLGERLGWTVGVVGFYESTYNDAANSALPDSTTLAPIFGGPGFNPAAFVNATSMSRRSNRNYSYAAYFEGDWHFSDATTFTFGVRRTEERREQRVRNEQMLDGVFAGLAPPAVLGGGAPSALFAGDCTLGEGITSDDPTTLNNTLSPSGGCHRVRNSLRANFWSWNLVLQHNWTDSVMTYVRAARGQRSGNHSARPSNLFQVANDVTDPEKILQYEIGVKSQLWDDRVRLNAAYYFSNFSDIQIARIEEQGGVTSSISENGGRSKVQGVELEATVLPLDGLVLTGSFGWNDTDWTSRVSTDPNARDASGNLIPIDFSSLCSKSGGCSQSPDLTYSLSAMYSFPAFDLGRFSGDLTMRADWTWKSETDSFFRVFSRSTGLQCTSATPCTDPKPKSGFTKTGSFGLLNGQIIYALHDTPIEIVLWGKNLTDKQFEYGWIDFPFGLNIAYTNHPREVGLTINYRFGEGT